MNLVTWPDIRLMIPAKDVTDFSQLKDIIEEMFKIITTGGGLGLAAPQIGIDKKFFVYQYGSSQNIFINPILTINSDAGVETHAEGCLSFPGVQVNIERAKVINLSWQDLKGEQHQDVFFGYPAIIIQHEYDHLLGKTISSYLGAVQRDILKRKMIKAQKALKRLEENQKKFQQYMKDNKTKPDIADLKTKLDELNTFQESSKNDSVEPAKG